MLDQITPLILTYNEAPNIGRTLEQLRWAQDAVVIDSFSDDQTLEIVSRFPQVRIFQRKFDSHHRQWNFGLMETGIQSEWVLALDADFVLSDELVEEIRSLQPGNDVAGYEAAFIFYIDGRPVRTLCPPLPVLYRKALAEYRQDGHTQKLVLQGEVRSLASPIRHDDRKSFRRWLQSQRRYSELEAEKLLHARFASLDHADKIRRLRIVAPLAMLVYCLFIHGAIRDGRAGIVYSAQRMIAELFLSLRLLEHDLRIKRHNSAIPQGIAERAAD